MVKVVINSRHGGFGLSEEGEREWLLRSKNVLDVYGYIMEIPRDDPSLVEMVEYGEGGFEAWGTKDLKVVEIPDDVQWHIHEYDGLEHVAENHRTWYAKYD